MKKSEWRDNAKSLTAAAVALLWAFGTANGEGMTLAEWRAGQALEGMEAVEGRAKVDRTTREAFWRFCLETTGAGRVQMGRPRLAGTNEWGGTYDLPFKTEDGAEQHLGVFLGEGEYKVLYRTLEGDAKKDDITSQTVVDYVLGRVQDGSGCHGAISMADGVFTVAETSLSGEISRRNYPAPFDRFYILFCDDLPDADWGHPARVVFAKDDLTELAIVHVNEPVEAVFGGSSVAWNRAGGDWKPELTADSPETARRAGVAKATFPAISGGDASRCHVLLVSGGWDEANNHCRYWNEICFVYNVMVKRYSVPRKNITVLWAGGDPAKDLCRNGVCSSTLKGAAPCKNYPFETDNLYDFDLDGNNDIDGAATFENLKTRLAGYQNSLTPDDQLLVFFSDHGSLYGSGTGGRASICLWHGEVKDSELAEMTKNIACPVMCALKTCYSGGMKQEFIDSANYRAMATAAGYAPSGAHVMMGDWTYYFFSALCGYYPVGTPTSGGGMDPRSRGSACDADLDGDGRVSFWEAHQFAFAKNPFSGDIPEYGESPANPNLGKKLFLTQYADVPPAVKEKAATPVLSPAGGSAGYAPAVVKASCGTAGATIRYTLDGSEPTEKSAVAEGGKITLTADKTVKARAFKSGMEGSATATGSYTIARTGPEKATIVSVSQGDSSSGIVVDWLAGEGTETFDLLRSESPSMSSPAAIASGLASTVTSWADLTAKRGKTYYYQIRSVNGYGKTLSGVSLGAWLMLNPPDGVTVEVTAVRIGTATVKVSWNAAEGASHYRVWRSSPDGTTAAVGPWQTAKTFTDTVTLAGTKTTYAYQVQAGGSSSGANPSAYSNAKSVSIDNSNIEMTLVLKTSSLMGVEEDLLVLAPGENKSWYCSLRYADGTSEKTFLDGPVWSVKGGSGIRVTNSRGSYSSATGWYTAPRANVQVEEGTPIQSYVLSARYDAPNGKTVTRDFTLIVSDGRIVKKVGIYGDSCLFSGEVSELGASCQCYGDGSYLEWHELPEGTEVTWAVVGGGGATLSEDGELTAWPVDKATNITVEARVPTCFGEVFGTRTFNILPASALTVQTAVIPPLGGASTNLVGQMNEAPDKIRTGVVDWLSGYKYHASPTANAGDIRLTVDMDEDFEPVGFEKGSYAFISFKAGRNPGKDRETLIKFRWSDGGINFRVVQQEAPYAKDPTVSGGADGVVTAGATTDGAVLHYATDGEEPSGTSPVMNGKLEFDDDTVVAVKAFGEWLQASGTAYADVTGKMSKWDEVKIRFVPGKSGVAAPKERTYKVNETFGKLPTFAKTGGLFFKGWTLQEGSERVVGADESVPGVDSTLYGVWSETSEAKPEWTALPWNFKGWMTAMMVVSNADTHALMGPEECSIGIVDAKGTCRGGSENGFGDMGSELHGKNGLHVFGVYSDAAGGTETGLVVKVWVKGKGYAAVGNPDFAFCAGETSGSEARPHVIRVGTGGKGWYTVAFEAGTGGSGVTAPQEVEVGATTVLPGSGFRRAGHAFAGWGWTAAGGVAYAAGWSGELKKADGKAPAAGETVTLYAQWKELSGSEVRIEGFELDAGHTTWTATVEGKAGNTYWLEETGRLDGTGAEWTPAGDAETPGADGKVSLTAPMRTGQGVGFFKAMESK